MFVTNNAYPHIMVLKLKNSAIIFERKRSMPFENETMPIIAPKVGYAYVPGQQAEMRNLYSPEDALNNGTIFPILNKPLGVYGKEGIWSCSEMGGCDNE